jgi:hypothetical protein
MSRTIDLNKWRAHIGEISALRKSNDYYGAKVARIFFLAGIIFIVLWKYFGIDIAIGGMVLLGGAFMYFVEQKGLFVQSQNLSRFKVAADKVEENLFQRIALDVAPWLRVSFSGPLITEPLKKSELLRDKIDFVNGSRCITGCYADLVPFCATHVEVGYIEDYFDSEKRPQKRNRIIFQGMFVIVDVPSIRKGWVTLESDHLEKLGWLVTEWRNVNDTNFIQLENPDFEKHFHAHANEREDGFRILTPSLMQNLADFAEKQPQTPLKMALKEGALMAVLPMKVSPFILRNNEAVWSEDLNHFSSIVGVILDLLESIKPDQMSERSEFSA